MNPDAPFHKLDEDDQYELMSYIMQQMLDDPEACAQMIAETYDADALIGELCNIRG